MSEIVVEHNLSHPLKTILFYCSFQIGPVAKQHIWERKNKNLSGTSQSSVIQKYPSVTGLSLCSGGQVITIITNTHIPDSQYCSLSYCMEHAIRKIMHCMFCQ